MLFQASKLIYFMSVCITLCHRLNLCHFITSILTPTKSILKNDKNIMWGKPCNTLCLATALHLDLWIEGFIKKKLSVSARVNDLLADIQALQWCQKDKQMIWSPCGNKRATLHLGPSVKALWIDWQEVWVFRRNFVRPLCYFMLY